VGTLQIRAATWSAEAKRHPAFTGATLRLPSFSGMTGQNETSAPRVVAVIPARGGSKGVPGKNLRRVGGVPLVVRAVASARAASLVDAVVVSTDHDGIAEASRAAGASVIRRPAALSGDTAGSEPAVLHALDGLDADPGVVVFLQCTSPFIDPRALDEAVAQVLDGRRDVVFSAVETHAFLWRESQTGAVGVNHDHTYRLRRQDREAQFQETGAFYVMRTAGFRHAGYRFFGSVGIASVDPRTAVEVDTEADLEIVSALAAVLDRPEPIDVDAVVTDFDGVHTDDLVHLTADCTEFVTASRSDGMGVEMLRTAGIPVLVLSKERNAVVAARARKLRVESRQGLDDKAPALTEWMTEHGLDPARVAYVGNDVNDLGCFAAVGWPVAVADAHPQVAAAARIVLGRSGGRGAVRELAERVLAARAAAQPAAASPSAASPTAAQRTGSPVAAPLDQEHQP